MHGFLNLLFAVVLLEGKLLPEEKIEDLLLDRNPNHFHFSENGLGWMGVRADLDQIRRGRQRFLSYGSCSFTEPIEDLTHLGFLNR